MRILFVSHSFPPADRPLANLGGMQRVAIDLHRALDDHPAVELRSLLLRTTWRWTGFRTPGFLLTLLREIPKRVREERIDVVLFSSMVTASVVPLLARRLAAARAITAAIPVGRDVTLPNVLHQRLVPRVLRALDLVLPISRATAGECIVRGARPRDLHVVPCGVDLSRLPPRPARPEARARLHHLLAAHGHHPDENALLLLSVGRHQERKGFHWFVEKVMPRAPANAVYLLAGTGPTTDRIRASARTSGVEGRVRLLGAVSDEVLATLYQGADLFVMPNIPVPGDIEGFGVVMLEAGASGLPVLAADLEGIRDVVADGVSGRLVPSSDPEAFLRGLRELSDPVDAAERSARAARYVAETFAWPSIADRYLEIFRERRDDAEATGEQPAAGGAITMSERATSTTNAAHDLARPSE